MGTLLKVGRAVLAVALLGATPDCGAASTPKNAAAASAPAQAAWPDALQPAPKLLLMLRPRMLRADRVYGPALRRLLELARLRRIPSGTLVLEAIEDADEVVAELEGEIPGEQPQPAAEMDLVLVVLGVRADIDPTKLVGGDGEALWAPGPPGPLPELVHERDADGTTNPASLFELADRVWVVAAGTARQRVREALWHPTHRQAPSLAEDALAAVRIDGPSLVERAGLRNGFGPLAKVARGIGSVTLDLLTNAPSAGSEPPGSTPPVPQPAARARLEYATADAAAAAASTLRDLAKLLGLTRPEGLAWLASAEVHAEGSTVLIRAPIPRDLLSRLLGGAASAL